MLASGRGLFQRDVLYPDPCVELLCIRLSRLRQSRCSLNRVISRIGYRCTYYRILSQIGTGFRCAASTSALPKCYISRAITFAIHNIRRCSEISWQPDKNLSVLMRALKFNKEFRFVHSNNVNRPARIPFEIFIIKLIAPSLPLVLSILDKYRIGFQRSIRVKLLPGLTRIGARISITVTGSRLRAVARQS